MTRRHSARGMSVAVRNAWRFEPILDVNIQFHQQQHQNVVDTPRCQQTIHPNQRLAIDAQTRPATTRNAPTRSRPVSRDRRLLKAPQPGRTP
ncbi:MAG TPA: hypothetical protein VK176_01525 [Phycisphaerales bacterium]|nr:hypothetical protein [Phycisphaerales bacterium]